MNAVPDALRRAAAEGGASPARGGAARPPRLTTLEAFEAAARLGSFGAAAAELKLSPSAISKQMTVLERDLGVPLFDRGPRGASLTRAGQRLHAAAAEALERVAAAAAELRSGSAGGVVRLSVAPRLAEAWLLPRLHRFQDAHPQVSVALVAESRRLDRRHGGYDLALRYAAGGFPPGIEAAAWLRDELVPVAAPALLRGLPRRPEALAALPWLHDRSDADWRAWLAAAGKPVLPQRGTISFADHGLAVEAAIAGRGVLVGRTALVEAELRDGRLVEAVPLRVPSPRAYHLLRPARARGAAVSTLWSWLLRHAPDAAPSAVAAGPAAIAGPGRRRVAEPGDAR